jgi:hypothetical protein
MAVTFTGSPSTAMPGQVVGQPIRLPHVMLCTQGERHCGRTWTANTRRELTEKMAERRTHEAGCQGGLILAAR